MVFAMAGALWGIGAAMGAPKRQRFIMLAALFVALCVIHLTLPDGHPLRVNTGGSIGLWLMIAGFGGVVLGYREILKRLRAKNAPAPVTTATSDTLSEAELDRYARHMVLPDIGGVGQMKLKRAKVLVIGAGGLGSPALMYLAASGVGTLGVIDDDTVDASNLQRQILHADDNLGAAKTASAVDNLYRLNPYVTVRPYQRRLDAAIAADLIADYDLVLDGSDNFDTRQAVNAACVAAGVPLVAGGLSQWEGTVSVFANTADAPCYTCAFPAPPPVGTGTCAEVGVFAPLPGVIGTMMAAEAIKLIVGAGLPLSGRILIYDARDAQTRTLTIPKIPDCPTCGGRP